MCDHKPPLWRFPAGNQRPPSATVVQCFGSTARTHSTYAMPRVYFAVSTLRSAADGRLAIAKLLLAHGADPDATTQRRKSALSLATVRNHPEFAAGFRARAAFDKYANRKDENEILSEFGLCLLLCRPIGEALAQDKRSRSPKEFLNGRKEIMAWPIGNSARPA